MAGKIPAQATANSVMASAKRLMELRHDCRNSKRIAEISVPAWPMPIHHTKLTMAKPQPMGIVDAPDADALQEQVADGVEHHHRQQKAMPKPDEPSVRSRTRQHDGADFVRDRAEGVARPDHRELPGSLAVILDCSSMRS